MGANDPLKMGSISNHGKHGGGPGSRGGRSDAGSNCDVNSTKSPSVKSQTHYHKHANSTSKKQYGGS